jgi:outer membrane protein assembly factor BamB
LASISIIPVLNSSVASRPVLPANTHKIMRHQWLLSLAFSALVSAFAAPSMDWPQFRGPGGNAISDTAVPPIGFGPSSNLIWKVPLPLGYSSPVVAGERIFVTSDQAGLEILALNRKDGRMLWRQPALSEKSDPNKNTNRSGRAASTPVTDGVFVYAFFGTVGLIAYDLDGTEQWRRPLLKPDPEISASPIIIDDKIIIVCDVGYGSFVEALDKRNGRSIWRTERDRMLRSFSTPFHWVNDKRDELIVSGSYWLTSYDPRTGKQNWQYSGTAKSASSTPVALRTLLVAATAQTGNGSGEDTASRADPFNFTADFSQVLKSPLPQSENALFAVRPCGRAEINQTHVAWKNTRSLPSFSSPIIYQGRLFTVKAGGFVSAYNLQDGTPIYQDERLNAPGEYYASPVAAAGRIYFISQNGIITVIDATADNLIILAQNKMGEPTLATPALVGTHILIRSEKTLYAFATAN